MSKTPSAFDFRRSVSYDAAGKRAFHARTRRQLKHLADALGLAPGAFDLRSNQGGIAVSGEVTLHADRLYVQACQPATGHDTGILFRTCRGEGLSRRPQQLASLDLLNRPRTSRAASRRCAMSDLANEAPGPSRLASGSGAIARKRGSNASPRLALFHGRLSADDARRIMLDCRYPRAGIRCWF